MSTLRNNQKRAETARAFFYIMAGLLAISFIINYMQYDLLKNKEISLANLSANESRQAIIALFMLAVHIGCVICFIRWMRRAYFNLHIIKPGKPKFSEGWAAGAWFVPLVNLARPYKIVNEIWEESEHFGRGSYISNTQMAGIWWALFLIGNFLSNVSWRMERNASSLETLQSATIVDMLSNMVLLAAAIYTALLIKKINQIEEQLAHVQSPVEKTEIVFNA